MPYAVSWNLTSRCNLACQHCYLDATARGTGVEGELSTDEALRIVAQIAQVNPEAVLILTGGEPLARPDIYQIASRAAGFGMMVVIGTNGTLLNRNVALKLKESGVTGVGVSLDSITPEKHDAFRGVKGAFFKTLAGLNAAKDAGLAVQVQTTPTRENLDELPQLADFAHRLGAKVFNIFFLVCTGRGEKMTDITPDEYEKVLNWAVDAKDKYPGMLIRPKCAPHFKRILHQRNPDDALFKTYVAACRAGTHYARIDPVGKVTPCPYMDIEAGDLRTEDFGSIWEESEVLNRYRTPEYGGKCGMCRYRLLCGGCRARAYALIGDDMGEDYWCVYEPVGQEEAIVNEDTMSKFAGGDPSGVEWSAEALETLGKVPVFARAIVRASVEKYAKENGLASVTLEDMRKAAPAPRRFMVDGITGGKPDVTATGGEKKSGKVRGEKKAETADTKNTGAEILWDADALARVQNAPDFVRPGILKLMPIRARQLGKTRITTEFLSEIRDESMQLATRRMKKLGFAELTMDAWKTASDRFKKSPEKREVIGGIVEFLNKREGKREDIMEKFDKYFGESGGKKT
jgi:radical SAM protein with 4Fe4S-binding SPASM domain